MILEFRNEGTDRVRHLDKQKARWCPGSNRFEPRSREVCFHVCLGNPTRPFICPQMRSHPQAYGCTASFEALKNSEQERQESCSHGAYVPKDSEHSK